MEWEGDNNGHHRIGEEKRSTCVHACVRVRVCACVCVREYMRAYVRACVRACVRGCECDNFSQFLFFDALDYEQH